MKLDEGDELIDVRWTGGERNMLIATSKGQAVKFSEKNIRPMGRTARGVRGIKLKKKGDEVIGMVIARKDRTLFTITENGYGKRTNIDEYRLIGRGGSGVKNIICSERNGDVVGIMAVKDEDELMLISQKGVGIRVQAKDISVIGRATQGVRIMKLSEGDKVAAVAKIVKD